MTEPAAPGGNGNETVHLLVVLRHAKSDWAGDEPDEHRPLAARGRRQAPETGRWLADNLDGVDLAVVSPATRARETWELVSAELRPPPAVEVDERVYAATGQALVTVVHGLPESAGTVALVGHNPGLEDLVFRLTGRDVLLPTSAVAVLRVTGPWLTAGRETATVQTTGRPPAG